MRRLEWHWQLVCCLQGDIETLAFLLLTFVPGMCVEPTSRPLSASCATNYRWGAEGPAKPQQLTAALFMNKRLAETVSR